MIIPAGFAAWAVHPISFGGYAVSLIIAWEHEPEDDDRKPSPIVAGYGRVQAVFVTADKREADKMHGDLTGNGEGGGASF